MSVDTSPDIPLVDISSHDDATAYARFQVKLAREKPTKAKMLPAPCETCQRSAYCEQRFMVCPRFVHWADTGHIHRRYNTAPSRALFEKLFGGD